MEHAISTLIGLIGPSGKLVVTFGAFVGAGEFVDRVIRDDVRNSWGAYLASGALKSDILDSPTWIVSVINGLFGRHHWSLKCLLLSMRVSIISFCVITALLLLHSRDWRLSTRVIVADMSLVDFAAVVAWVLVCFLSDYLNLYKTRVIVNWLARRNHRSILPSILAIALDGILYCLIFFFVAALIATADFAGPAYSVPPSLLQFEQNFVGMAGSFVPWMPIRHDLDTAFLGPALFVTGLAPSIWLWMCALTIIIARAASKSRSFFAIIRQILPVEESPGRTVGIVAGGMFTIVYAFTALIG